jgi:hypothetical protein
MYQSGHMENATMTVFEPIEARRTRKKLVFLALYLAPTYCETGFMTPLEVSFLFHPAANWR